MLPVCLWETEPYSQCSATCEGRQTRAVTCVCTEASTSRTTTVGDDVCDGNDPRPRPSISRSCGSECPAPEPKRGPRECNLTECQNQSDCYNDECCRRVDVGGGKLGLFCFPLLHSGAACDPEETYTCPCARGFECKQNSTSPNTKKNRKSNKKYMARVKLEKGNECPRLYKKSKLEQDKYRVAVCQPDRDQSGVNFMPLSDGPPVSDTVSSTYALSTLYKLNSFILGRA